MQALIDEIAALAQKITSGTATLGELEAFAAATQQLNERAIVLRYKAYEAKVYGVSAPLDDRTNNSLDDRTDTPHDHGATSDDNSASDEVEISAPNDAHEENSDEDGGIDTIGDELAATADATLSEVVDDIQNDVDLSFDLFSMDDSEEDEPAPVVPAVEAPKEEPVQEMVPEVAPVPTPPTRLAEEAVVPAHEAIDETVEEVVETPPASVAAAPIPDHSGSEHPILRKARTNDGSLQSRLLSVRLETLKSAFGLNERLQIIQELFAGSHDEYNAAIEDLDNQAEVGTARSKVSAYAHRYGWREDSELAVEFVQKVERRYA